MYKFLFVALLASAVFPDWPIQAFAASQDLIEGFQTRMVVVGALETR